MKHFTVIRNFFKSPTLAEIITNERRIEEATIAQCDEAIRNALFQKSLSCAKVEALNKWAAANAFVPATPTNRKDTP